MDTYDVTSYTYDIYGRMLTATQQMTLSGAAGTTPAVTSYTYNVMGMKTSETTPRAANAAYDGQFTASYAYDTVGRLSQVSRKYENGAANQTVTTQYTYDAAGNQVSVTDEAGRETTYTYDSMNRVASVTNALNETTSYSYDPCGQPHTGSKAERNLDIRVRCHESTERNEKSGRYGCAETALRRERQCH